MKRDQSLSKTKTRFNHFVENQEMREIKSNPELLKQIKKGLARLKKGRKRYSFEDVFGEPLK